jgi:AmmeMemoRadiSam system protein B
MADHRAPFLEGESISPVHRTDGSSNVAPYNHVVMFDGNFKPLLRPVEAFGIPGEPGQIGLRDRSGLSDFVITVSPAALQLIAMMDGSNSLSQIAAEFEAQVGHPMKPETLQGIVRHLDEAHLLEGERFEAQYEMLLTQYRVKGVRTMERAEELEVTADGRVFHEMIRDHGVQPSQPKIRGLIAPHLDYARGGPCYGQAFSMLRELPAPRRVIILGTNHFGRATGVVSTASDFQTPLGTTRCDRDFLASIESHCGHLRQFELDHAREHSVELQVAWLQFLWGAENFSIAPFLCPDPCGPTGMAPRDGIGVDLRHFSDALTEQLTAAEGDTLVIAGADFSHVGGSFGDERDLDDEFLEHVRRADRRALDHLEWGDPDGFVRAIAERENPTRICSAGCMFALASALPGARGRVLRYHQAVDRDEQCCVTCAAVVFE